MPWPLDPLSWRPDDADLEPPPMDHGVGGRKPRQYSDTAACIALARAARGETVEAILAIPGMPSRRTFYDWLRDEPRFRDAWDEMRARQALARQHAVEDAEPIRMIKAYLAAEATGRRPGNKRGRRSTYTRAAAEAWCALIADGATLREAARHPGMPDPPMVYRWLRNHPEFREMYMAAAEYRDMVLREEAVDLANTLGYGARGGVAGLLGRAGALMPDVWR